MIKKLLLLFFILIVSLNHVIAQSEFVFEHFNVTSDPIFNGNNFRTVAVGRFGKIWAGSQYHGIVKYDPVFKTWSTSLDLSNVLCTEMERGYDEDMWIGHAGLAGGASNAGGVNRFMGYGSMNSQNFYSITAPGRLASRNVRGVWVDENHLGPDEKYRVWVAQASFLNSGNTAAGGVSVGLNVGTDYIFTKIYKGLQVTPNVPAGQAGTPSCISVGGGKTEVWVCATGNFGKSQVLRYRADDPGTFIGYYDYTNTPELSNGFKANAIFFDVQDRAWLGLNDFGLRIKTSEGWKTMNDASVLPSGTIINANAITQDERGYIYFGTSSGLLIYKGGPVDVAGSYELVTTSNGLPSNAISDVAADTVNNRIILAHNAGISFMKFKTKLNFSLEWDHGFPKINIKPLGVAADGTSRLYVKVRRGDNGDKAIKKISVSIKNAAAQTASIAGKLKKALELNQYSNEANSGLGTEAERTDSTVNGDFYFWYVAPDDFSADSLGTLSQKEERMDTINIKATYADNSVDSSYMEVKIVRPPLMFTSMLSGAKSILENVKVPSDPVPIMASNKFGSKMVLAMNQLSSLAENVSRLIDGDQAQNEDAKNSYQGILQGARNLGIAATRIDIVANDIAGVVIRATQAMKPAKFFADGDYAYNNYGKGFINKFISVDVPHNGSTLAQIFQDFAPRLNEIATTAIGAIEKKTGDAEPFPFVKLEDGQLKLVAELLANTLTDAGNYKLPETVVKNHLIATELTSAGAGPGGVDALGPLIKKALDEITLAMRDFSPVLKPQIGALLGSEIGAEARILGAVNSYSTMKGLPNSAVIGDLISNVSSQLAGLSPAAPNVTKKVYSFGESMSGVASTIGTQAKKIINLLNTGINSPAFGSTIPANSISTAASNIANKIGRLLYDTAKIVITNRQEISTASYRFTGGGIAAESAASDTSVLIKFTVKDTALLQYVYINYQDTMYTSTSKNRNQQVSLRIKRNMLFSGVQALNAVAVYENADSIKYHADTLKSWVNPPLVQGFRINEASADLFDGIAYKPAYEVKVDEKWELLPANDPDISFTIESPAKVSYSNTDYSFNATADGFSRVYFLYKTYRDTVEINGLLPLSAIATNRSVVNGNFKDSATWSKGRPPLPADSVIISAGHTIVLDTTVQIRSLRIDNGGTLTLNNSSLQLKLGDSEDGDFMLDNYGTLNISNGSLKVSGRVRHNAGSNFNMSGGFLIIDGNTGNIINSLRNGQYMFEALPGMSSFNFSAGSLQLIDPPIGVASQALFCNYNFGLNSKLILGNGISVTASHNPNGFGGNGFPPQIGKLVLDAAVQGNNRQLKITKPLSVKTSFEVRNGSKLSIEAPVTVIQ